MANYVCYSLDNGAIEHTRQTTPELIVNASKPDDHVYLQISDEQMAEVSNMNDWYVDLTTITFTPRPVFDIPEQLNMSPGEERTYTVPNGTEVDISGDVSTVEDETLEIVAYVAGNYEIALSLGSHKPLTVEVIVNETST
jgi:hypothetical protein